MDRLAIRETLSGTPQFLTLVLVGELDVFNVSKLSDTVVRELEAGQRHLLIDLAGVTQCDNGSLYTLLGIRHAASHAEAALRSLRRASASRMPWTELDYVRCCPSQGNKGTLTPNVENPRGRTVTPMPARRRRHARRPLTHHSDRA